MPRELIDLSHPIEHGMVTYPGLPAPVVTDHLTREVSRERYRGEAEFHIGRIEMVANTGTYIDAPSHRVEGAADIAALPLGRLTFLRGVLVHLKERALTAGHLAGLDLRDAALLVHTGWSRHWRTDDYGRADHPYVSRAAAEFLAQSGVALVGIDSVNIDDMADFSRPAHTLLLRAGTRSSSTLRTSRRCAAARSRSSPCRRRCGDWGRFRSGLSPHRRARRVTETKRRDECPISNATSRTSWPSTT